MDAKMNAKGSADLGNFTHVMAQNPPLAGVMSVGCLRAMLNMDEAGDMSMVPPAMADMVKKIYADADAISENFKSSLGFSYGIGDKGLWGMQSMKVKSVDTFMSQVKSMMTTLSDSNMGFTVKDLKMIDPGVGYTLHMDMQKMMDAMNMGDMVPPKEMAQLDAAVDAMLGGEVGMQIRYLNKGDHVVAVFGRNGKLLGQAKRLLTSGEEMAPNVLDSLVSTAQGTPTMAMTIDMRSAIKDIMQFLESIPFAKAEMGDVPSVPSGDPIRLDLTCTAMQKGGQCVINFDLGGMAEMVMELEAQEEAMRAKKAAMAN